MSPKDDIEKLIAGLDDPESQAAEAAGRRLIEAGHEALPSLLCALPRSSVPIRRRVAFIVGELLGALPPGAPESGRPALPLEIERALHGALEDADWKVRRNAAVSLGKLGRTASPARIVEKLMAERDERVRTSLILAFGKLADPADAALFHTIEFLSEKEKSAALKVFDRFRGLSGAAGEIDASAVISAAARVELWCRSGIAEWTSQEARERGLEAVVAAPDRARVMGAAAFDELLGIRTALYPALVFESKAVGPEILGRRFSSSSIAMEMRRLTRNEAPHYRLTLPGTLPGWPMKRDWIAGFAASCEGLVNAATGYSWEIVVKAAKGQIVLGARPTACRDSRFLYRKAELPASVHPTLAAAAVRLVPAMPDDVVLDPFCGSGSLLAERALRGPYRRLIGSDIDPDALKAAERNLEGLSGVSLRQADAIRLKMRESVSVVVSNPPYGQRVGTEGGARKLHNVLDTLALTVLRAGGFLVVFRPPGFAGPAGMELLAKKRIDAGGLPVDLVVARQRPKA